MERRSEGNIVVNAAASPVRGRICAGFGLGAWPLSALALARERDPRSAEGQSALPVLLVCFDAEGAAHGRNSVALASPRISSRAVSLKVVTLHHSDGVAVHDAKFERSELAACSRRAGRDFAVEPTEDLGEGVHWPPHSLFQPHAPRRRQISAE